MAVGDLERFVLGELQGAGYRVTASATFDWLTGRGPLEPEAAAAPNDVRERLIDLHADLGGDAQKLANKPSRRLPVDFDMGNRVLMEVDETQHFTSARLRTIDFYEGLDHDLDLDRYRDLCVRYVSEADAYYRSKQAADFLFPGGRTAHRAYFDAVRDLLAPPTWLPRNPSSRSRA